MLIYAIKHVLQIAMWVKKIKKKNSERKIFRKRIKKSVRSQTVSSVGKLPDGDVENKKKYEVKGDVGC